MLAGIFPEKVGHIKNCQALFYTEYIFVAQFCLELLLQNKKAWAHITYIKTVRPQLLCNVCKFNSFLPCWYSPKWSTTPIFDPPFPLPRRHSLWTAPNGSCRSLNSWGMVLAEIACTACCSIQTKALIQTAHKPGRQLGLKAYCPHIRSQNKRRVK